MDDPTVLLHGLSVERFDGERVRADVMVTSNDTAALVFGDREHDELTLQIQARCPANLEVLDVSTCDCADRYHRGMRYVSLAPLGMFVYVNTSTDIGETYYDVGKFIGKLPNVRRVRLLNYTVAEASVLRDAGYQVTHLNVGAAPPTGLEPEPAAEPDPDRRLTPLHVLRNGVAAVRSLFGGQW